MMKVRPGEVIQLRDLVTVNDHFIAVPDPTRLTHLQFRRFVGCPICSLHLQSVTQFLSCGMKQHYLVDSGRRDFAGAGGTSAHPTGGRLGLPADILIDQRGTVLACKYGSHAYDQWSVDELLQFAALRA
jgi:hypothetical protein